MQLLKRDSSILREISIHSMKQVADCCSGVSLKIMLRIFQTDAEVGKVPIIRSLEDMDRQENNDEADNLPEDGEGQGGEETSDEMEIDMSKSTNESSVNFEDLSPEQNMQEKRFALTLLLLSLPLTAMFPCDQ
eukprot:767451-Hanusia_phi.AAC.11